MATIEQPLMEVTTQEIPQSSARLYRFRKAPVKYLAAMEADSEKEGPNKMIGRDSHSVVLCAQFSD
jgi:hypothetical protein